MSNWLEFKDEWAVKFHQSAPDKYVRTSAEGVGPLIITGDVSLRCRFMAEDPGTYSGNTDLFAVGGPINNETENFNNLYLVFLDEISVDGFSPAVYHEGAAAADSTSLFSAVIPWGKWVDMVIVRDTTNTEYSLYINGVYSGSSSYSTAPTNGIFSELTIGQADQSTSAGFQGQMSSLAIWDRALSEYEISQMAKESRGDIRFHKSGLQGLWLFGDGKDKPNESSEVRDHSGNDLHVSIVSGGPGFVRQYPENVIPWHTNSFTFDGVNESISFSLDTDHQQTGDITFAAWVKPTLGSVMNIVDVSASGETEATNALIIWGLGATGTQTSAHEYGAGNNENLATTATVNDGEWQLLVLRRDDTNKQYVFSFADGSTETETYTNSATGGTSGTFSIGRTSFFTGNIAEIGYWDRYLTDGEVAKMYSQSRYGQKGRLPFSIIGSGLIDAWAFGSAGETTSASEFTSYAGYNGANGSAQNMAAGNIVADVPVVYQSGIDKSMTFDGTNEKISFSTDADHQITGDLTIACWFKYTGDLSAGKDSMVIHGTGGETEATNVIYQLSLTQVAGVDRFSWFHEHSSGSNISINNTGHVLVPDVWTFAVIRRNSASTQIEFIMNGVSSTTSYSTNASGGSSGALHIGYDVSTASNYFEGSFANLGVWNRMVTDEEAERLYNNRQYFDFREIGDGLVHYSTFGNTSEGTGSSEYLDLTGTSDPGTAANMAAGNIVVDSPFIENIGHSASMSFNGKDERFTLSALSDLEVTGDMSFVAWIKTSENHTGVLAAHGVGGETEATNFLWEYRINDNTTNSLLGAFHESGAGVNDSVASTQAVPNNTWTMVAITRDVSDLEYTFYINDGSGEAVSFSAAPTGGTSGTPYLAAEINAVYFKGNIAQLAMWDSELTAAEISALYNNGNFIDWRGAVTAHPLSYYAFGNNGDGTGSSELLDMGSAGSNGSGTSMADVQNIQTESPFFDTPIYKKSMRFNDGVTNERVTFSADSDHQITGDFSFAGWIKVADLGPSSGESTYFTVTSAGETEATNTLINLWVETDASSNHYLGFTHEYGAGLNEADTTSTVKLTPDQWHFVAVVRDTTANEYEIYVDTASETLTYTNDPTGGTSSALEICALQGVNSIDANVTVMALYDSALSSSDVSALYNNRNFIDFRSAITANPVSYFGFGNLGERTGASQFRDSMGQQDGTCQNMTDAANIENDSPFI